MSEERRIRIEAPAEGLKITIEGSSEQFFCFDLSIRAITHLIRTFDVHGMEKHEGFGESTKFYGAVVLALLQSYRDEVALDTDGLTPKQALDDLLSQVEHAGYLPESFPPEEEDDWEEDGEMGATAEVGR